MVTRLHTIQIKSLMRLNFNSFLTIPFIISTANDIILYTLFKEVQSFYFKDFFFLSEALFERVILNPSKLSSALKEMHPNAETVFRDAYIIEFLELPEIHQEAVSYT